MAIPMEPFSPCRDCQERTLHCHSTCEKYGIYAIKRRQYLDEKSRRYAIKDGLTQAEYKRHRRKRR